MAHRPRPLCSTLLPLAFAFAAPAAFAAAPTPAGVQNAPAPQHAKPPPPAPVSELVPEPPPFPADEAKRLASFFSYARPQWHEAKHFKRISEYFTQVETTEGDIISHSDKIRRDGMYFHIGLPLSTGFPAHSHAIVEYIHSDSPEVAKHIFELPEMKKTTRNPFAEIRLGLTGKDWPSVDGKGRTSKRRLVAWRLTFRDNTGVTIGRTHSFLWSLAEKGMP